MKSSLLINILRKTCFLAAMTLVPATALCQDESDTKQADLAFLKDLNQKVKSVNEKATPATVALISPAGTTGSGVIVSREGLILTAAHVIEGVDEVSVVFPDGSMETAKVLGANFTRDAAMAQLSKKGPWPFAPLGEAGKLKVGDYVVALGHSKGFDLNRRPPIRFGRLIADGKQRFMMSECTLIGGDSGGPLFNLEGEVVGIHSSIGPNVSINNHVPLDAFRGDWQKLVNGEQWGRLGLHPMQDPDLPFAGFSMLGTRSDQGIIVGDVLPGSPAAKAGLKEGDLIIRIGDRKILNTREYIRELERYKPNDSAEFLVVREGQTYKAPLVFGRRGDVRILER